MTELDTLEPRWQDLHILQTALNSEAALGWERPGRPVWVAAASNILGFYVERRQTPTPEVWLNLTNIVGMNPPWQIALADNGWRMPSAGEAFNQVSTPAKVMAQV